MNEAKFFRLKDIQTMFGVSRATVWRWHAERGLRVVSVGGITRVRECDLKEFIERHLKAAIIENQGVTGVQPIDA
jgi:predicted DNA-binding transcriptional regulator AlpA